MLAVWWPLNRAFAAQEKILKILGEEDGPEVVVLRKGNTYLIKVDVMDKGGMAGNTDAKDKIDTERFKPARKTTRGKDDMDVDYACQPCVFGRRLGKLSLNMKTQMFRGNLEL